MTMARAVAAMPMKEMSKGVETCLEKLGFVAMLSIFLASSVGISSALDRVGLGLLASFVIFFGVLLGVHVCGSTLWDSYYSMMEYFLCFCFFFLVYLS